MSETRRRRRRRRRRRTVIYAQFGKEECVVTTHIFLI
jgi:hypothetical protein